MKKIQLLLILMVFISGCAKEDSPTQPKTNPYSGEWQIVFAGTYTGGGEMSIAQDGKFSVTALLEDNSGTFTNIISGSVSGSGSMTADIYYSGSKIGTASGSFTNSSGSGSYQTLQPSSGTWVASKK